MTAMSVVLRPVSQVAALGRNARRKPSDARIAPGCPAEYRPRSQDVRRPRLTPRSLGYDLKEDAASSSGYAHAVRGRAASATRRARTFGSLGSEK